MKVDLDKIRTRVKEAMEYADSLAAKFAAPEVEVPEHLKEAIEEAVKLGIVQYAKGKRRSLQREIYLPSLVAEEMDGIALEVWVMIMQWAMKRHGIKSGLGMNSAREYKSKHWLYFDEAKTDEDFELAVWGHNDLGKREVTAQKELFNELAKELNS
jgi:hypothetical protein